MSEMVEHVALALLENHVGKFDVGYPEVWGLVGEETHLAVLKTARAVIAAMREPTEAMRRAGNDAQTIKQEYADIQIPMDAGVPWRAMIDAALNDQSLATNTEKPARHC